MRIVVGSTAVIAGWLATQAIAQAPPPTRVVAEPRAPGPVAAYRGWAAWSTYDSTARRYHLTLRSPAGAVKQASVPPRRVAFDVDMGRDSRGRVVAVYTRCRREAAPQPAVRLRRAVYGRDCAVFQVSTTGRQERRVTPRLGRIVDPAIDGRRLVFAELKGRREAVVLREAGRNRRLPTGPEGSAGAYLNGLDISDDRIIFGWNGPYREGTGTLSVRTVSVGGRTSSLVDRQSVSELVVASTQPAVAGTRVLWAALAGRARSYLRQVSLTTRQVQPFEISPRTNSVAAVRDGTLSLVGPFTPEECGGAFNVTGEFEPRATARIGCAVIVQRLRG